MTAGFPWVPGAYRKNIGPVHLFDVSHLSTHLMSHWKPLYISLKAKDLFHFTASVLIDSALIDDGDPSETEKKPCIWSLR